MQSHSHSLAGEREGRERERKRPIGDLREGSNKHS